MTDLNPSEVLAEVPAQPQREQYEKAVQDKMPGHISYATDRANFPGGRLLEFYEGEILGLRLGEKAKFIADNPTYEDMSAGELMNAYFARKTNLLVINMGPIGDGLYALVTSQLDDEDLEEFQEVQRRVQLDMREWRKKRAEKKALEAERIAEHKRLIEVGKKAEQYNLFEKLRKLEALVEEYGKGGK
jgi:sulfur relay (sulfurtransferase) DsrF/TusC family protein